MAVCGPHAIPFTFYARWPDSNGHRRKHPTWDEYSRAAHEAWRLREAEHCRNCGQARSDWADADWDSLPAKVAVDECPACELLERARKAHGDLAPGESLVWRMQPPDGW